MKNARISVMIIAVLAMFFTSCSKEDNQAQGPDEPQAVEKVSLSFDFSLQTFDESKTPEGDAPSSEVPLCNEDSVPETVRVSIRPVVEGVPGPYLGAPNNYIDIPIVDPAASIDSDGDGETNYLTLEHDDLELEAGEYEVVYFAILNAGGDIIWIAPSSNETYGPANFDNFVVKPLPYKFMMQVGTKHYEKLEVLCYDDDLAPEYGYLFFDFDMLPLTYLCIFGNECDDTGRHFPSNFNVMVWDDAIAEEERTPENALFNGSNDIGQYDNGEEYAKQLCIPLPDRPGENLFYFEIHTIADGQLSDESIRSGYLEDEYIKEYYFDAYGDVEEYWHFREGPFCGEDSDPCLILDANGICANATYTCNDEELIQTFPDYSQPDLIGAMSSMTTQYTNVDTDNNGDWNNPETGGAGRYLITESPENYLPEFIIDYMGKMILFDSDDALVAYTIQTPDLCAGDTYYLRMDLYDVAWHKRGEEATEIKISATNSSFVETDFQIQSLTSNVFPENQDHWKTVVVSLEAAANGPMIIEVKTIQSQNWGNDWLMDNLILSPNPDVLNIPNINLF